MFRGGVIMSLSIKSVMLIKLVLLSSISGIAGSFRIEPNEGIAIRIPLIPPYKIHNDLVNGTVTEVVMFVSRSKTYYPTLLIITKENQIVAVHVTNHNLKDLLERNRLYTTDLNLNEPTLR